MVLRSWVSSANDRDTDFPLQNLPYGVFCAGNENHIGVAIGNQILDLRGCAEQGLLADLPAEVVSACTAAVLNPLMALGSTAWSALRRKLTTLLGEESAVQETRERVELLLAPMSNATMQLPAQIGGYTDFYASIHHAERVGRLFRPENPLLPNYKYVPIGYNGRTSSIVVSGTAIRRPCGQLKPQQAEPAFAPARSLDYELEVGAFVGPGNALGQPIPIVEAEEDIFGLCLVNDWSARDIQSWEYQPLGPFLAKNFATTISPWVVPLEALTPFRVPAYERPAGDPAPLPYLNLPNRDCGGIDLTLEVYLASESMRRAGTAPMLVSRGNLRHLYWTLPQLVTHHASNGCNLRPGDLLATGTVSGPEVGSEGCLLEKRDRPEPVRLPNGEERVFLEDGDQVVFRGYCQKPSWPRIGFGECTGTIVSASVKG